MSKKIKNIYEKGKAAYFKGKPRKPTDDGAFMQELQNVRTKDLWTSRRRKKEMIDTWKSGWDDAKKENQKKI